MEEYEQIQIRLADLYSQCSRIQLHSLSEAHEKYMILNKEIAVVKDQIERAQYRAHANVSNHVTQYDTQHTSNVMPVVYAYGQLQQQQLQQEQLYQDESVPTVNTSLAVLCVQGTADRMFSAATCSSKFANIAGMHNPQRQISYEEIQQTIGYLSASGITGFTDLSVRGVYACDFTVSSIHDLTDPFTASTLRTQPETLNLSAIVGSDLIQYYSGKATLSPPGYLSSGVIAGKLNIESPMRCADYGSYVRQLVPGADRAAAMDLAGFMRSLEKYLSSVVLRGEYLPQEVLQETPYKFGDCMQLIIHTISEKMERDVHVTASELRLILPQFMRDFPSIRRMQFDANECNSCVVTCPYCVCENVDASLCDLSLPCTRHPLPCMGLMWRGEEGVLSSMTVRGMFDNGQNPYLVKINLMRDFNDIIVAHVIRQAAFDISKILAEYKRNGVDTWKLFLHLYKIDESTFNGYIAHATQNDPRSLTVSQYVSSMEAISNDDEKWSLMFEMNGLIPCVINDMHTFYQYVVDMADKSIVRTVAEESNDDGWSAKIPALPNPDASDACIAEQKRQAKIKDQQAKARITQNLRDKDRVMQEEKDRQRRIRDLNSQNGTSMKKGKK